VEFVFLRRRNWVEANRYPVYYCGLVVDFHISVSLLLVLWMRANWGVCLIRAFPCTDPDAAWTKHGRDLARV
jgi:hypothetical protein